MGGAKIDTTDFEFDELKMYFREPIKISDRLTVYQPTIGDIVEFNEKRYFQVIYSLTCIPSDMMSQLDDLGIDYMKISDFSLFIMLSKNLSPDDTKLVLGDLDLSSLEIDANPQNNEIVLKDRDGNIIIDQLVYLKLMAYLRSLHQIKPKIRKAANETTRKILIRLDRENRKKHEKEPYRSTLKPLISAMMRYPGFKYKSTELKECGLYEFMDTVEGAQIYISTTALLQGMYSGMVDVSKINKKEFDWMRSM